VDLEGHVHAPSAHIYIYIYIYSVIYLFIIIFLKNKIDNTSFVVVHEALSSSSKSDHWREMARKMGLEFFVTKNSFSSYFHFKNT
jgi:hypothetical protein